MMILPRLNDYDIASGNRMMLTIDFHRSCSLQNNECLPVAMDMIIPSIWPIIRVAAIPSLREGQTAGGEKMAGQQVA
jgi:hypothetical protein